MSLYTLIISLEIKFFQQAQTGLTRQTRIGSISESCILLPIGTNSKPLAAIGKFPSAIGKLVIGKTWATNGEEFTNAMINDALANQW